MRRVIVLCVVAMISFFNTFSAERQSVGLVLSGGGAKGIAHAGVIQALEENDIPIDYIAGTSMGAIVGGLYASGYTPKEITDLILSDEFSAWSTGKVAPSLTYYYLKPHPSQAMVRFNIGGGDSALSSIVPSSFINPFPMNIGFVEVFAPHTALCEGDFNKLFVPFRCVTSDVYNKKKVVLSSGDLGEAIRMSMSFPIAFKPIDKDSIPMFDGGIYDNFPVDVMKTDFAPDIIIGVDVTVHEEPDMESLISQLESMIIQQEDYELSEKDGIKIHVDLKGYNLLDFPKANEIFKKGYLATLDMIDSLKNRVGEGISKRNVELNRQIYKSKVPDVKFRSLKVLGTNQKTERFINHIFFKNDRDTISFDEAKDAYYRTITSGKFYDLLPRPKYDKQSGLFDLVMKADLKNNLGVGIGGFITSTTNSMAFLSVNYETLALNSFSSEAMGWFGQSYYGGLANARISLHSGLPMTLGVQGGAWQQKYYEDDVLFFEESTPSFITKAQFYGNLYWSVGVGRHSKFQLTAGYGFLKDRFYPNNNVSFIAMNQDEQHSKLGQLKLSYDYNTLDNIIYPSKGVRLFSEASGVIGEQSYSSEYYPQYCSDYYSVKWAQIDIDWQQFININRLFSLGYRVNALASTKKLSDTYTSTLVQAPAFEPTQYSKGIFMPSFRSNSFVAGGLIPIVTISDGLQLRTAAYAFSPMRRILSDKNGKAYYGGWFGRVDFLAEASLVYNLSFASLSIYGDYTNYAINRWSFGVSFGWFITAPKFLR